MSHNTSTLTGDTASDAPDRPGVRPDVVRWLIIGNAAAIIITLVLAGTAMWSSHGAYEDRAAISVRNSAGAMQQAIDAQVQQVDLLLRAAAIDIDQARRRAASGPDAVQRILMARYGLLPELQVLRATDSRGVVRYGTGVTEANPIDVSDRDYFIRARDNPVAGLVISEPVFGRTSRRWVVAFARRLNAADGSFDGIVYSTLSTRRLNEVLSGMNLGREGAVALRTGDLRLITRSAQGSSEPEAEVARGSIWPELTAVVASQPEGGTFTTRSAIDHVKRISAYLPVADGRLYVIAGLGTDELMAPWRAQARVVAALAAAVIVVLVGASSLLLRMWRREVEGMAQLKLAARRNKALLRTASDGIHVLDRTGRLVDCSDSFARMLGYELDALLGRNIADWEARLSPAQLAQWCAEAVGRNDFKTCHRRADGTLIDVEVTTSTLCIDGQDLIYCSSRDVTERHRLATEAAQNLERARRSEQRVREVSDNVPASIIYVDSDERLQFANATFGRMVGQPPEALIGRSLLEVFGDRYALHAESIATAMSGTPTSYAETSYVDGHLRHTESRLMPKRNAEGALEGFYSLTHDLTQRVELERLLSVQRRNLTAMTAVSGDVTVVIDRTGTILVANRAFEDHWALAPGAAEGLSLDRFYGTTFCENEVWPKLDRVFAGETISLRATHSLRGGRPRAFDVTYQPVRTEEGTIDAMVFTSHDIDDLVETVNRLQRTNESLQHFVRITSHDLREPLNTISQFVDLIESAHAGTPPQPIGQYLAFVSQGARRMRNMLDDLSRYVRLDDEAVPPDECVALDPVMAEVASALADQVDASHGTLTIESLPAVHGTGSLVALVFRNLVSNGLKFTRPGVAPHVTVSARVTGDCVDITVADEGVGIAQDDLPRVVEPFRRLHRRQIYDGTGLGLATCQRIATALGGRIDVQSKLGAWTRVTVTLRLAENRRTPCTNA